MERPSWFGGPVSEHIRVFLADDHAIVRKGLEALIASQIDMTLVGTAVDGVEAVKLATTLSPDVILMDIQMPKLNGIEAIKEIKRIDPQARILVLTSFGEDETVFAAIKAGALGYLLKDSSPADLIQAIHHVYHGRTSLHPEIALKLIQEIKKTPIHHPLTKAPLTEREVDILRLVARGLTNQEIADKLIVSERTVRTHISNILAKLHLANRTQAALYALRQGYANLEDE